MALIEQPSLLVLRALGLGDLLTAVPALRALRHALPQHRLVLAADPVLSGLAHRSGAVDEVLPARELQPLDLPGPGPELAVNLHGRGPQSHQLLAATGPRRMVAFGCPAAGFDGPAWRSDEHEVARWCRLVEQGLGVPADRSDLVLRRPRRPAGSDARYAVVHPGAANPARRWPADRFASVAAALARHGLQPVVTGSRAERPLAEQVAARAGLGRSRVVAGSTSVDELAALVAHAGLVVCGDTGVAHLATAFETPSVVLFGPTPVSWWGPPKSGPHIALWHGEKPGDPWADRPDPALLAIDEAEVLSAAERLLAPPRRHRRAR